VKKLVYIKTNSRAFSDSIAVEESGSEDDKTSGSGSV
jgi:hypothetical protein